jgi:hypothetical protein
MNYVKVGILSPLEVHGYAFNSEGLSKRDQTEDQDYENNKESKEVTVHG